MDLPSTIYDLPFLTEQAKRNILGGNAIRLFNLEPDHLGDEEAPPRRPPERPRLIIEIASSPRPRNDG